MDWPSSPVLLSGVPAKSYHRDDFGDVPTLSRSVAHMGITVSWRHAAAAHPRLAGTITRRESKAMDHGSLVHALLLSTDEDIAVIPCPDFRTKAAQALRDTAYEIGKTPVLMRDYEEAQAACEILKPEICRAIWEAGNLQDWRPTWEEFGRELVALWEEITWRDGEFDADRYSNVHAGSVRCRARWDLFLPGAALIADLKVVTGGRWAQAAPFIRQLNTEADSGAMQAASYLRGLAAVHPETAGRGTFVFLRAEPYPPYSVVPIVVTEGLRQLGEERWMRGVAGWARCMASGVWPGPGVAYAQAESWAVERELQHAIEEAPIEGSRGETWTKVVTGEMWPAEEGEGDAEA